jgi:alkylation response protein AidB-like acyl-CoA dehydrogenase
MHFAFTEDQLLFRDTVRDLLTNECKPEAVRAAWGNDTGRVPGLWDKFVEMGVAALTAPEAAGGLGMNEVDLVLLRRGR